MSGPVLLDANALFALVWPTHEAHTRIRDHVQSSGPTRWATCTLTELAVLRLSQNPVITGGPTASASTALAVLRALTDSSQWTFLATTRSVNDEPYHTILAEARGYRTITDIWLVGLALEHHGKLLTLDHGIVQHMTSKTARAAVHILA